MCLNSRLLRNSFKTLFKIKFRLEIMKFLACSRDCLIIKESNWCGQTVQLQTGIHLGPLRNTHRSPTGLTRRVRLISFKWQRLQMNCTRIANKFLTRLGRINFNRARVSHQTPLLSVNLERSNQACFVHLKFSSRKEELLANFTLASCLGVLV